MRLLSPKSLSVLAAGPMLAMALTAQGASSGNLIVNGGAETGKCVNEWITATTVPGWTTTQGNPAVVCYTITSIGTPSSSTQGSAFLADGPYGDSALSQTINVASAASAIDSGSVTYNLSGWLGGYSTYNGQATVLLTFLDANGKNLGAGQIGPVTPYDRGYSTKLLSRASSGAVPIGTRLISVLLQFNKTNGSQNVGYADNLSLTLSTPVTAPALTPPVSAVPAFDHVFVVMMENTDYSQIVGDLADAPYINGLFSQGALLTNYNGVYHPSDENYLALAGGDTYITGATYYPNVNDPNRHIGDLVEAAGKTWMSYEMGMGTPCNTNNNFDSHFHADDAPFMNYTNISGNLSRCQAHLVDLSQMTTDLLSTSTTPAFAWVAADNYYNGEDAYYNNGMSMSASIQAQNSWLSQTLPTIFNSPAWQQQKSLLILTWDESSTGSWVASSSTYNQVVGVALASQGAVKAGYTSPRAYDHYSISRTIESALGLGGITPNDIYAQPLNDVFTGNGVPLATLTTTTPTVSSGANITFTYLTPYATFSAKNWVGIYPAGVTPGSTSAKSWQYASSATGNLTFSTSGLSAGSYVAYYLYNDGYQSLMQPVPFTVQ